MLTRHFEDNKGEQNNAKLTPEGAWAWVQPIPLCVEVHVSLEVLTMARTAVLLYSGPEHGADYGSGNRDLLLLELRQGRPVLLLDLGGDPVTLTLNSSSSLADNTWHRIDLIWKDEVRGAVFTKAGGCIDLLLGRR